MIDSESTNYFELEFIFHLSIRLSNLHSLYSADFLDSYNTNLHQVDFVYLELKFKVLHLYYSELDYFCVCPFLFSVSRIIIK